MVEGIPSKPIKKIKPLKKGYVFFTKVKPNKFLLERRPSKGILGGLLGFPTTKWNTEKKKANFPFKANWTYTKRVVTHQFSHFKLELEIILGDTENPRYDNSKFLLVERENFDLM